MPIEIRELAFDDKGYAIVTWREGHKQAPGCDRVPWAYYKHEWVPKLVALVNDKSTLMLGAYNENNQLLGWLAATPGKRVDTLHWVHVRYELDKREMRRRGIATALIEAADLGDTFIYTLHGRHKRIELPDGSKTRTIDDVMVAALGARGVTATYVALKEWLK